MLECLKQCKIKKPYAPVDNYRVFDIEFNAMNGTVHMLLIHKYLVINKIIGLFVRVIKYTNMLQS